MNERALSVFVDESGDFGPYQSHSPYYLVSMVLHDQDTDISENIAAFRRRVDVLGFRSHAVHTGPLIRREKVYKDCGQDERLRLFNALFHFVRQLSISYICVKIKKSQDSDKQSTAAALSERINSALISCEPLFRQYDRIIIYYDNGQEELNAILKAAFCSAYPRVEFRRVKPADYALFQAADLCCTAELLAEKASEKTLTKSELGFFGSARNFKKNYYKHLSAKKIGF